MSFHLVRDLKATQMSVKHCLNQELMLYEFKLGYSKKHLLCETTKNIYVKQLKTYMKGEIQLMIVQ